MEKKRITTVITNGCDKRAGSKCNIQVYFLPADKPLEKAVAKKN